MTERTAARTRSHRIGGVLALVAWAAPDPASAHLVSSGMGPFYDGVAHFLITAEDLVIVVGLALLGGLSGRKASRRLVVMLPLGWLAGAALGMAVDVSVPAMLPSLGILTTGLLVALNPRVPNLLPAGFALVLGLLHGFLNGRGMSLSSTPFLEAIGIVTALAAICLLVSALVVTRTVHWQCIAVRALGSWIAAVGILTIAWNLRPES